MNVSLAKPPSDMKVKEERKMQHLLAIGARKWVEVVFSSVYFCGFEKIVWSTREKLMVCIFSHFSANDSYWGQQSAPAGPRIPIGRGRSIRAPVISSWAGGAGGYRGGRSIGRLALFNWMTSNKKRFIYFMSEWLMRVTIVLKQFCFLAFHHTIDDI